MASANANMAAVVARLRGSAKLAEPSGRSGLSSRDIAVISNRKFGQPGRGAPDPYFVQAVVNAGGDRAMARLLWNQANELPRSMSEVLPKAGA